MAWGARRPRELKVASPLHENPEIVPGAVISM
jgi:hypothetical protein